MRLSVYYTDGTASKRGHWTGSVSRGCIVQHVRLRGTALPTDLDGAMRLFEEQAGVPVDEIDWTYGENRWSGNPLAFAEIDDIETTVV